MVLAGAQPPKVFISYAWSTPEHDEWVVQLAHRLEEHGVEVVFDKWDLKPGQDKYAFMERMAAISDKVLVICDCVYKTKADERAGGVGTETQILSQDVYEKVGQDRVIPIIAETDDDGKYFVPTYIRNRIFIDLSSEDTYEEGYEQLLRHLFDRPLHRRPMRGVPPAYLFDEDPSHYKTTNIIAQMRDALQRNPARVSSLTYDFVQEFLETLEVFKYNPVEGRELDDVIVDNIHNLLPLRDDYVRFVELQCEYQEVLDPSVFVEFFERVIPFTQASHDLGGYDIRQFDHYKFFLRELFLFTVMIMIEKSRFSSLERLLRSSFFFNHNGSLVPASYDALYMSCNSLDDTRNMRLSLQRMSVTADLLVERSTKTYGKQKLVQADLLLYYIGVLCNKDTWHWYPITHVFNFHSQLPFVQKLQSHAFAERVMGLFGASSVIDLKKRVEEFKNTHNGLHYLHIPSLQEQISADKIGIVP